MFQIAIVGAGVVANFHAAAIRSAAMKARGVCLRAVCDALQVKADEFAAKNECKPYTNPEEMLDKENIDVVILSIPTFLHADYVERCAARGKHVLCEKPMEMSRKDAERIVASRDRHGVKVMVAQVVRFWPGYVDVKRMYEEGELGDILMAVFSRSSTVPARGGWIIDPEKGRGAIQDMHIHDIDFLTYMFGEAAHVYSHAVKDYTGCYDHVISSITFKNGIKAAAEAAFSMKNSYPFSSFFRVCGTKATVEYRYRAGVTNIRANAAAEMNVFKQGEAPVSSVPEDYDPFTRQLAYFLDCVEKNKEPEIVSLNDSLKSISLLDAIRESAETGKIISIANH